MQKTIYTCDICDTEVSYKRGSPSHLADWIERECENGKWVLLCSRCNHVLIRARELGIKLPEYSDTVTAGGAFVRPGGSTYMPPASRKIGG